MIIKTPLRFAITSGDPAGIGPEVSLKAIALSTPDVRRRLVLIADLSAIKAAPVKNAMRLLSPYRPDRLPQNGRSAFIEMRSLPPAWNGRGKISAEAGRAAGAYIKKGAELAMAGEVAGIVTAPIHKQSLALAGFDYPGHTEMLAALSKTKKYAMMLAADEMRVVVLTTHLSLRRAIGRVTRARIIEKLELIHRNLGPRKPIGVCGLNPHASDGGLFGDEEERTIVPAIAEARRRGIDAEGPLSADTAFAPGVRDKYGAFLAMYHDQGLVAIKAVAFGRCANITLGLPFIRSSADHGTAFDIAGKGTADPASMLYAVKSAFALARTRSG